MWSKAGAATGVSRTPRAGTIISPRRDSVVRTAAADPPAHFRVCSCPAHRSPPPLLLKPSPAPPRLFREHWRRSGVKMAGSADFAPAILFVQPSKSALRRESGQAHCRLRVGKREGKAKSTARFRTQTAQTATKHRRDTTGAARLINPLTGSASRSCRPPPSMAATTMTATPPRPTALLLLRLPRQTSRRSTATGNCAGTAPPAFAPTRTEPSHPRPRPRRRRGRPPTSYSDSTRLAALAPLLRRPPFPTSPRSRALCWRRAPLLTGGLKPRRSPAGCHPPTRAARATEGPACVGRRRCRCGGGGEEASPPCLSDFLGTHTTFEATTLPLSENSGGAAMRRRSRAVRP